MKLKNVSMIDALETWRDGNNRGAGYAPYRDKAGDDTITSAILQFMKEGWEVVLERNTSDDVAVLQNGDGDLVAIGGDARGELAWAVDITAAIARGFDGPCLRGTYSHGEDS